MFEYEGGEGGKVKVKVGRQGKKMESGKGRRERKDDPTSGAKRNEGKKK